MIYKLFIILFTINLTTFISFPAFTLPPPEDTPEEVLRNEIITEGRSHEDNKPLTASEYAELQVKLAENKYPPQLTPKIQKTIILLELQKFLRTITPW